MALCFLFFSAIACRLAWVQAKYPEKFESLQCFRNVQTGILPASRGRIYDVNGNPIVDNRTIYRLFVNPNLVPVDQYENLSLALHGQFGCDYNETLDKLQVPGSTYQVLINEMTREEITLFESLPTSGELAQTFREVGMMRLEGRVYPYGPLAGPIIGFTSSWDEGQDGLWGLEEQYDETLACHHGRYEDLRDERGHRIPGSRREIEPARNGSDLFLTLDTDIQAVAKAALQHGLDNTGAAGGAVVITEPSTGEIRALVSLPTFDQSNYQEYLHDDYALFSRSTCLSYEPGSVAKIFTVAAGLEEGIVTRNSELEVGLFPIYFRGGRVTDHDYDGPFLSLYDIIVHSSNRGAALVAVSLGEDRLWENLRNFGFGRQTGLGMPGEPNGDLKESFPYYSQIDLANMGFGQGITVTPLQIAQAVGVFANDGILVPLTLIRGVSDPGTDSITETETESAYRVISLGTAGIMEEFMTGVVVEGTATAVATEWPCAGKTGTAQKVDPLGGYYDDRFYSTFVGYGPLPDPRWLILVILDEPVSPYYGGAACGPVFREIFNILMLRDSATDHQSSVREIEIQSDTGFSFDGNSQVLKLGEYVISANPFGGVRTID